GRASLLAQDRVHFCNSREADAVAWLREQTEGGADLVFECVGKADTYGMAIECAAPMGTVVLMGNPYGDMSLSRNTYWKILRDQLTLTGTWNSSFDITGASGGSEPSDVPGLATPDDWHYVLDRLAAGSIRPAQFITHRLPLSDLERGLQIMRDKTEDYCKVMIGQ
ncbi:MAG: zinc-binding dehydrogenase, partial [Lachnospiraceae bacterium]|nr:zinc-binding dehydrogenase [Lachnospiraceae bacterium]